MTPSVEHRWPTPFSAVLSASLCALVERRSLVLLERSDNALCILGRPLWWLARVRIFNLAFMRRVRDKKRRGPILQSLTDMEWKAASPRHGLGEIKRKVLLDELLGCV